MAKKRALGRGLDSLLGSEPERVDELPTASLKPSSQQPRVQFEDEALEELARSIASQGVVQPLVVTPRDGGYLIVAGERRWRAARKAGLETVPVVVREVDDDRQLLELALVENLQRSDLNPLEEAEAYRRLQQEFGLTQEQIAARVGKSRSAVANAIRLLNLPGEVRELLLEGRLTAGQARPLLALDDVGEQVKLAKKAAGGGLSARQVEARTTPRGSRAGARPAPDPDTAEAAERLTRRLQAKVEIRRSGRGGTVRIGFHSEEELMRLYDVLMEAGRKR